MAIGILDSGRGKGRREEGEEGEWTQVREGREDA